ncbi:MAG: T9SS type A sorting domain-containing protein [Bacteroidota bacterium]
MKKTYFLSIALYTMAIAINAQTPAKEYLDINNIKAAFYSSGDLFWDLISKPEFEVPKGHPGKTNSMFASALWVGGIDAGGQLKLAGQTYRQSGNDFWPGPLNSTATIDSATMNAYNKLWKINKCDIDAYSNWFNNGQLGANPVSTSAMNIINTWPTVGPDGSALAPFVDVDGSGTYDPSQGDYPQIKGDQAVFFVFNDKAAAHTETGGAAIGLEIQAMAYAYNCTSDSALYNTIFTDYKFINKSPFRLDSTFIGFWTDFELGYYLDDHIGCDVTRGAMYAYNTDPVDGSGGPYTFGTTPPAQAVVFLGGPWADPDGLDNSANFTPNGINYDDAIVDNERLGLSKFTYYDNDFSVMGHPQIPNHNYGYLAGRWKDGTPFTYGGNGHLTGAPCNYAFPGTSDPYGFGLGGDKNNPQTSPDWTAAGTAPGDKGALGSTGPFAFQPGAVHELNLAYVFGRAASGTGGNGNLVSISVMQERIDSIRNKFNTGRLEACMCNNGTTGIKKLNTDNTFNLYPNPATNTITISYKSSSKNYSIKIYAVTGRMIKNRDQISSTTTILDIEDLNSGIYLLNVSDGLQSLTHRFVKE